MIHVYKYLNDSMLQRHFHLNLFFDLFSWNLF